MILLKTDSTQIMEKCKKELKHFVLVHGVCHGAWCWYKVMGQLKLAGHRVTALDMAASGIDSRQLENVRTVAEYSQPLIEFMENLPAGENVILVGHSLGGLNISVAMEMFPEKISVAVFLTAFMPDTVNLRSHVIQKLFARTSPDSWLDTLITSHDDEPPETIFFGPEFMKKKLYQNCSMEDFELAMMLIRPGSLYIHDMSKGKRFTAEAYGSVKRIYVVCGEDLTLTKEFQLWIIKNYGSPTEVVNIPDADHMAMLSKPDDVVKCLLGAAENVTEAYKFSVGY